MLRLDPVTRAAYDAGVTTTAKVAAIRDALVDPVTVKVMDSALQYKGIGTMATPWASVSSNTLIIGQLQTFTCSITDTPESDWILRFESGDRWVYGSFGLVGSGADFVWSLPTFEVGQEVRIGDLTAATFKGQVTQDRSDWFDIIQSTTSTISWIDTNNKLIGSFANGAGGTYDLKQDADIPNGTIPFFTVTSPAVSGIAVEPTTGILAIAPTTAAGYYQVRVGLDTASTEVTTFSVVGGGSNVAWTTGHAFKRGDIPMDRYITIASNGSLLSNFQVDVRNWWKNSDGSNHSVKFAVLSGIGGTDLTVLSSPTTQSNASVASITSGDVGVTGITINGQTTYLADAINGANLSTFSGTAGVRPETAGKLRDWAVGPVMVESHYYSPVVGDPYLGVFWYVRKYANGTVEIETIVENGWFQIAPISRSYTANVTINGTVRRWHDNVETNSIVHHELSRWSRADIVSGVLGEVIPNVTYLTSTKLVPNYGWPVATSETAFTFTSGQNARALASVAAAEAAAPTPLTNGMFRSGQPVGGEGLNDQLGLLPHWDAVFLRTGDIRAYRSVVFSGRTCNFLPTWRRDERTLTLPRTDGVLVIDYPSDNAERQHQPSTGFLAYLVTGRYLFMEACQNTALFNFFKSSTARPWPYTTNSLGRDGARGLLTSGEMVTRAIGWAWRSLVTATAISPDGSLIRSDLVGCCNQNVEYFWWLQSNSTMSNSLGIVWGMGNRTLEENKAPDQPLETFLTIDLWQHAFLASSIGWTRQLEVVDTAYVPALVSLHEFSAKAHVGPIGDAYDGSGFSWRRASVYRCLTGYPTSTVLGTGKVPLSFPFTTWRAVYEKTLEYCGAPDEPDAYPATQSAFSPPAGYGFDTFSYGFRTPAELSTESNNDLETIPTTPLTRNIIAPLGIAADYGIAGAAAAYSKLTNSLYYQYSPEVKQRLADFPRYMVTPR